MPPLVALGFLGVTFFFFAVLAIGQIPRHQLPHAAERDGLVARRKSAIQTYKFLALGFRYLRPLRPGLLGHSSQALEIAT